MAKKKYSHTDVTFQRWIKEGRGAGRGRDYKPWLTVRDLPSLGRSHRIFGHKSQRTHHLFSDLELAVFLLLEWQTTTLEIREQFPLQRELTIEIAEQCGIPHPSVAGVTQYMSSDFLVTASQAEFPKFAIQAKRSEDLVKPRVIEKLELERQYWQRKNTPWFLITEKEIPSAVFQNIEWLYPAQRGEIATSDLIHRLSIYNHHFAERPDSTIINIAKSLDVAYALPVGESLREIRQLLAHRFFIFDLYKPFRKLPPADLVPLDTATMEVLQHVQN